MNWGVIITLNTGQLTQHSGPSVAAPEDFAQDPTAVFFAQQMDTPEIFTACLPSPAFRKKGSATSSAKSISKQKNDMADFFIKINDNNPKI